MYKSEEKQKVAPMGKMKVGDVMGHASPVKHIETSVFPDQKKIKKEPSSNRGYDSEAWNYKY